MTYGSVISGDARDDNHQEKCDDNFNNQRLNIGSNGHCPKEGFWGHFKH